MKLTILTPTYNRKAEIKKLWESLCAQTIKDFEWLVVDDGSTDDTKEFIEQLPSQSDFSIRYIYKRNGGKHTALNVGIASIESELTFIVDSDDHITQDAVASILEVHQAYQERVDICGYAFLRAYPDGTVNGAQFTPNRKIGSYIDIRINGDDIHADKAEVFLTRCLKEFPFPEYSGERFLSEDVVWIRMARKYKMVHVNKVIYVSDYLNDGLTKNRRKHNIASPVGCMNRAKEYMEPDIKLKYRVRGTLQYIIYGRFAGVSVGRLLQDTKYKGLAAVCALPGLVLYQKWKKA